MRIFTVKLCDGQYQPSEFWDFFDCIRKAVFHSREATCLKWATQPWALTAKSNCLTWEVPPIDGTRWTTTPHTLALKVSLCPSHLPITYFCEASKTSVHKRQLLEGWQPYFQLTFSNFMKSRGCHCLELSCHWMKEMNQPHGGVKGRVVRIYPLGTMKIWTFWSDSDSESSLCGYKQTYTMWNDHESNMKRSRKIEQTHSLV